VKFQTKDNEIEMNHLWHVDACQVTFALIKQTTPQDIELEFLAEFTWYFLSSFAIV